MLTNTAAKSAQFRGKPIKISDEKGLYLLVNQSGRYWRMDYRFAGKRKTLALGVYPDVSLRAARDRRDDARKLLADGVDPSAARKDERRIAQIRNENSFEAVAREWLENIRRGWTPSHYTYTLRRFEAYCFSEIGHISIDEVDAPALLAMARKIEARGTVETAYKVVRACGQVFRYGIASGRCKANPAADLRGALESKPQVKHQTALREGELPELLRRIDGYAADSGGDLQTQLALQLLALTFVRTTELREATWDEFDLNAAEWLIPAERMKAKQPHWVPLSTQALEVIDKLRAINGAYSYVFPGRNPRVAMSKNTVLFALYRLGYRGRMTGHGFRAVASTILNEMNFDSDVIERQLAHRERNAVRASYHRSEYRPQRREMMQVWANHLAALMRGGEVIPIRASA